MYIPESIQKNFRIWLHIQEYEYGNMKMGMYENGNI